MPSIWENSLKETKESVMHGAWPNPFRNMIKRIDVLACEDTWLAMVEMVGLAAVEFFWTHFVPSPVEITRKVALGSYKCGFFSPIKVKSPIDIIWRDGRTSRMLLQIATPVTTGLFYWWAQDTFRDALSTFHSLQIASEMCDEDENETILRDGSAPMQTNPSLGSPAFATVMWDPKDRAIENDCIIYEPDPCSGSCYAFGYFESLSATYDNCRVGMRVNGTVQEWVDIGHVEPFEVKPYFVSAWGSGTSLNFQPEFFANMTPGGVIRGRFVLTRMIARIVQPPEGPDLNRPLHDVPEKEWEFCPSVDLLYREA